jgi:hypothetical protein
MISTQYPRPGIKLGWHGLERNDYNQNSTDVREHRYYIEPTHLIDPYA